MPKASANAIIDDNDDDDDSQVDDGALAFRTFKGEGKPKKAGVRFGSVRVRTHNLTLGDNPGGKTRGPPLQLEWTAQDSTRFQNIDEFAVAHHGVKDSLVIHDKAHLLEPRERQLIASRDHSAGSIRRVQLLVHEIREERKKSSTEDIEIAQKKDEAVANRKTKGKGFLNLFFK